VVNLNAEKSVGVVAFILTFLFGPLRLFYATVTGGVVMLAVEVFLAILGFVTLGWAGYCSGQPGSSPSSGAASRPAARTAPTSSTPRNVCNDPPVGSTPIVRTSRFRA